MDSCHLLRAEAWWLLLPLALLLWWLSRRVQRAGNWRNVCDAQLLPYLLQGGEAKTHRWPLLLTGLGGLLAIAAMSGPACERAEQPVFRDQSALVIALDLSRSMDATDIKPSRLERAKLKLIDILKQRREGQTALIAYAADAYAVVPLTDDSNTIIALTGALDSNMMPQQGSRADLAIAKAAQLLQQAGTPRGDILLISDGINGANLDATLAEIGAHPHRISVLSVGTAEGAPIALRDGGFLKDQSGAIVIPKMDETSLKQVAQQGHGRYHPLSADASDITYLLENIGSAALSEEATTGINSDQWREEGPWLLLLLLPLAALAFRRGYLVLLLLILLPLPDDSYAADLWRNQDQQALKILEQGDAATAAAQFNDAQWKAAAHYRAGQYQEALQALQGIDTAAANYNRGNALARLGNFDAAIKAYDAALQQQPDHEDAKYNRELVKQQMQKQQQQKKGDQAQQDAQADSQEPQQEPGEGQQQQQQSADAQNSQSGDQQQTAEQDSGQQQTQPGEQPQAQPDAEEKADQAETQPATDKPDESQNQDGEPQQTAQSEDIAETAETDLATEQWLRRIPDDPGGLLRRKFQYQYQQQAKQPGNSEIEPW